MNGWYYMKKEKIEDLISKLNPKRVKVNQINKEAFVYSVNMYIKDILLGNLDESSFTDHDYTKFINTIVLTNYFLCTYRDKLKEIKSNQGKWIKFDQGSDYKSLLRLFKNIDYSEFREEIIKDELSEGDYYVYCTLDNFDTYMIPRAKIVMKGNSIKYINAFLNKKNNHKSMEDVVEEKLKEFPNSNRKSFERHLCNLRKTTNIYRKFLSNEELSNDELRYLYNNYEIHNYEIRSLFDPRIEEIIVDRFVNSFSDLAKIYNFQESQIAIFASDVTKDTKYCISDLDYSNILNAKSLSFPENLGGSLDLSGLTSADGLVLPKHIGRNLYLNSLTSVKGLIFPEYIGGSLYLNSLTSADGLILPKHIGINLYLNSLTSADNLNLPEYVIGRLDLSGLKSADGLVLPKEVGDILLDSLKSANDLILPEYVTHHVNLSNITSGNGLVLPRFVGGYVDLSSLDSLDGLVFPESFDYDIKTKFGIINKDNLSQYINRKSL